MARTCRNRGSLRNCLDKESRWLLRSVVLFIPRNLSRRRAKNCTARTVFLLLSFISWLTCEPINSKASNNTELSDSVFSFFRACMLEAGSHLEDLAMDSNDVRTFVQCCSNSHSSNEHHSFWTEKTEIGPDARDLLSMSSSEIQAAFGIRLTVSHLIKKFIDRQLATSLPRRRYTAL
jgi:hypothetical protein